MFVEIRKRGGRSREAPDDPFALLAACHERVRAFSATSLKMLRATRAPAADVADAAGRVHLYFTVGMPLHAADEDVELNHLIRSVLPPDAVSRALETMEREHRELEAAILALAPTWAGLATWAGPTRARAAAPAVGPSAPRAGPT